MSPRTLLYRQAHPSFVTDGQLSSQAFFPFPKDEGLLSAYDGDLISAADSYNHYTGILKFESDSVWAATKAEADAETVPARPDPVPFPEHAVMDFTGKNDKECRKIAKRLRSLATARGRQHP